MMRMAAARKNWGTGILMVLPYFLLFACFSLYPILNGFRLSFFSWSLMGVSKFIGLSNYSELLEDEEFLTNVGHTFFFVVVSGAAADGVGTAGFAARE
ncbi:hypothetical protein [Paenibacillus hexagrammi]|uniref:Sugar ABC transporter permease n=1 Tax=Paenibacillus hexagrammi TaxID=2908839 RepID=A0ABY3SGD7_9BACL|nr:hypothetical protein [Paenibacillus sp. YPD9-1]UJF32520.1 hypothetical protein L0M14_23030 [Paenibacillus sp. YPD9-1]